MNKLFFELGLPRVVWLFVALGMNSAQAADDISERPFLQELPVVLSASRLYQPLADAPNAVTVIDRAMIKASGFRNVADLFKLVPGMYVDYQSGYEPIVGYHGETDSYSRRMQVLVDGRSVYLPPTNTVDWNALPLHLDDIERIEVVRGPAATSYGSNSIMGVINIITRDAAALTGISLSAARGNAGNADISDAVAHVGRHGDYLDYRFTLGMKSDNGFDFPADASAAFPKDNDDNITHLASLRSNYHPSGRDSLDVQLGFSRSVSAAGSSERKLTQPRNITTLYGYQQLSWLRTLNQYDDVQLHYSHISRAVTDERNTLPISGVVYRINENAMVHRHELELQHTLQLGANQRLIWGGALRYESVEMPSMFVAWQGLHQSRLFAHDEWRVSPKLLLNGGAMLEDDGMGTKNISPRIALNYHITPAHTVRSSISIAYRNPAMGEEFSSKRFVLGGNLYQNWLSSGGLRPERALSREIGYIGKISDSLSVDARVYDDQVSDMIWVHALTAVPNNIDSYAWDFRNEFNAHYNGLETTLKYHSGTHDLTFNYAYQRARVEVFGDTNINVLIPMLVDDFTRTVPRHSSSVLYARQLHAGWLFSVGYYEQTDVAALDQLSPQPWTRRVDLRAARQFGAVSSSDRKGGGEVTLVVQNVLQDKIVGYSGYLFDRRAFLTATLHF